jgi:hypothetical protein
MNFGNPNPRLADRLKLEEALDETSVEFQLYVRYKTQLKGALVTYPSLCCTMEFQLQTLWVFVSQTTLLMSL